MPDFNQSAYYNTTDASNTSPAPNGAPSGTYVNAVEGIFRALMAASKRIWERTGAVISSTGSANAYIYTPSNTAYPVSLVQGDIYSFKANFANTGAATLNVNALGATAIFQQSSSGPVALTGGEIQSGQIVVVQYDGTQFQLVSPSSAINNKLLPVTASFKNLTSVWASNTTASIAIDELILSVAGTTQLRVTSLSLTLNTANAGLNGLDTGTLASNTWYSLWVISNGTTNGCLISLSTTSPTLPSGYIYKARIGWVRTDGSSNLIGYQQWGRKVQFKVGSNLAALPFLSNGIIGGGTAFVATAALVPPTASFIQLLAQSGSVSGNSLAIAPNTNYSVTTSNTNPSPITTPSSGGSFSINASIGMEVAQTLYVCSQANAQSFVIGWEDNI